MIIKKLAGVFKEIGYRIRMGRESKNLKRKHMEELIPMSESPYARLEQGVIKNIDPRILVRISEILEIDLQELITGKRALPTVDESKSPSYNMSEPATKKDIFNVEQLILSVEASILERVTQLLQQQKL